MLSKYKKSIHMNRDSVSIFHIAMRSVKHGHVRGCRAVGRGFIKAGNHQHVYRRRDRAV